MTDDQPDTSARADDRVREAIAEAARRREANRARRARYQAARRHGLTARHALKLSRLQRAQPPDNNLEPSKEVP